MSSTDKTQASDRWSATVRPSQQIAYKPPSPTKRTYERLGISPSKQYKTPPRTPRSQPEDSPSQYGFHFPPAPSSDQAIADLTKMVSSLTLKIASLESSVGSNAVGSSASSNEALTNLVTLLT